MNEEVKNDRLFKDKKSTGNELVVPADNRRRREGNSDYIEASRYKSSF